MSVRATGLGMRAGDHWLFRGLDLDVGAGGCLVLAGHNGSGKSTVLHLLYGLRAPAEGTVEEPDERCAVKASFTASGRPAGRCCVPGLLA